MAAAVRPMAMAVLRRLGAPVGASEDLAQEVTVRIVKYARTHALQGTGAAFVTTCTRHAYLSWLRLAEPTDCLSGLPGFGEAVSADESLLVVGAPNTARRKFAAGGRPE